MTPAFHRLARAAKEFATRLTLRSPRLGLRMGGLLGPWSALNPRTERAPTAEDLVELFGPMSAFRLQRVRRAIAGQEFRNELMIEVLTRSGYAPLLDLITTVRSEPLQRLREQRVPVIAAGWHLGPFRALPLALEKHGIPSLMAIWDTVGQSGADGRTVRHVDLAGGSKSVAFLRRAHRVLGEGVVVGIQLDWPGEAGEAVTLFGRKVGVGRGAASLARLSGARLVPVTARFLGGSGQIEVVFHDPIPDADLDRRERDAFDHALLHRTAKWFEARIVDMPELLRPERVQAILSAPRLDAGPSDDAAVTVPHAGRNARRMLQKRANKRAEWEHLWGDGDFDARWLRRGICAELQDAVESGWFPAGGRALDAGCGEGDTAAWLASRGYETLGVDIAAAAIERARRKHGERPGSLRFERLDLCAEAPVGGPFHLIVDRGCYHQIDQEERRGYGRRLASLCVPGAPLLLFARAFGDGVPYGDPAERSRIWRQLQYAFGPYFRLERTALTYLDRFAGKKAEQSAPGVVFWFRRRAAA